MATLSLQKALDIAKSDPNSEFATSLRQSIESGSLDEAAQKQGVDLSKYGRPAKKQSFIADTVDDFKKIGTDIFNGAKKAADTITQNSTQMKPAETIDVTKPLTPTEGADSKALQDVGALASAGSNAIGSVFKGAIKLVLPQDAEDKLKELAAQGVDNALKDPLISEIATKATAWYDGLGEEEKKNVDAVGGIASLVSDFIGAGLLKKGAGATADTVVDAVKSTAKRVPKIAPPTVPPAASGLVQKVTEIMQRVPRAVGRAKENLAESAVKAEKIKQAAPEVAEAMKQNLDERVINTIVDADPATRKAYSDTLKLAEDTSTKIGTKKQPSIVSGDLATQQFDIINKQKKTVGKQIGDTVKKLSKEADINMQDSYGQIDDTLAEQGIKPQYTKRGVKLDFTGSKYTPAERTKIQELYNLATEGGDNLSALKIREKDQLFSKLKRESNFEGVGDLLIETPEGTKSLFNVFRDIYSSKLDTLSPELKALNTQYRKLSQLTDDIEDSIFKTPNFNVTKSTDAAEFAKVNLRRIFGESQSSPVFEAIADAMDAASRGLGYEGASPKAVAEFTQELRKLFPESVPKTGFQGGIKAGVSDIIEAVSKAGAPNIKDQQKAIRALLDKLVNEK